MNHRIHSGAKGFTIVELLIVVVVIAILAAITIVAYNGIREKAEATAFVAAVDAYEKEFYMYAAEKGVPYSVPPVIQSSQPQPGFTTTTAEICVPGSYPATSDYVSGECFMLINEFTYNGDSQPSYRYASRYKESTSLRSSMQERGVLAKLPIMPLTNNFRIEYTYPQTYTLAEAQAAGLANPRSGSGIWRIVQASRGLMVQQFSSSSTDLVYYLRGEQPCGRGGRQVIDVSQQLQDDPSIVISESVPKLTVCNVTIK